MRQREMTINKICWQDFKILVVIITIITKTCRALVNRHQNYQISLKKLDYEIRIACFSEQSSISSRAAIFGRRWRLSLFSRATL